MKGTTDRQKIKIFNEEQMKEITDQQKKEFNKVITDLIKERLVEEGLPYNNDEELELMISMRVTCLSIKGGKEMWYVLDKGSENPKWLIGVDMATSKFLKPLKNEHGKNKDQISFGN